MLKKNVILLGKGELAISIAQWFNNQNKKYNLKFIVPDLPEPNWTDSIIKWAKGVDIPIIESGNYKDIPEDIEIDLAISVFYGKIIKLNFINRCKKIINLHNGPLPEYRGVRPINWALKNNETSHGVTIHKITEGIDDGPILGQIMYPIYPELEEVEDVYKKSQKYAWLLFKDVMRNLDYAYKHARKQQGNFSYYSNRDSCKLGDRSNWTRTQQ